MHKRLLSAAVVAAGAVLAAAPALPAGAAAGPVLTVGNGTAVAAGDAISASLASGTNAFIATTSGGSSGISCPSASLSATITANPDSSGNADESVSALTTTSCTSNVTGVTGVNSVTLNNLPYTAVVTPAGALTVSGSIQSTVSLKTLLGNVTCVYTAPSLSGTAHNSSNSLVFSNQQFTLSSGPSVCPGNGFLSATLSPVVDATQGSQPVSVNPGQS